MYVCIKPFIGLSR